jgi:DNA-directed RNA polymerase sigma subunit (sigma70/sigma32)
MNKNGTKLPKHRTTNQLKIRTSSTHGGCTLSEVASMLGIGKERVRQIEARALAKVRKAMQEKGIGAQDLI